MWNVIVLVKQKSSVVLVLIISLMCIDSASTLSLCGFPVPPAHFPFLWPQDTKSDSPLEEVTGCHCLSLLIFTSPSLYHFKIPPSSHHHQHFKGNKWTSNAFDPVVTWLRKWKMIRWHRHYRGIATLIFLSKGCNCQTPFCIHNASQSRRLRSECFYSDW